MDCRQPSPLRFASVMPNSPLNKDWYKHRSYLHFDLPLSYETASALVHDSLQVAKHAFFPLIRFVITTKKLVPERLPSKFEYKPKEREIRYASHADAHIYSFYAHQMLARYESLIEQKGYQRSILAFRRLNKSNIHFAKDAFDAIKNAGEVDVIGIDIKDFFGSLDHAMLKERWKALLGENILPEDHYSIFRSLTKYSWVDRDNVYKLFQISTHNPKFGETKNGRKRICSALDFREVVRKSKVIETNLGSKGIPQGTPISALLSNVYMMDIDQQLTDLVSSLDGKYFRYCDDILLIVSAGSQDMAYENAKNILRGHLLEIQEKKTEFRKFRIVDGVQKSEKPLQYLGFLFDGKKIVIRSSALARYSEKMSNAVKLTKLTVFSRNSRRLNRGEKEKPLAKGKLYRKYSYFGRRNFVTYALKAAEILDSKSIKKQVRPLWRRLKKVIDK